MEQVKSEIRGWVLYDDTCGFCRRWVPFWGKVLRRRGFEIAPLQSPWVAEKIALPADDIATDLRLLLKDGTTYQGANVYRYLMLNIWWAWPIYLFSIFPGTRGLFDWGYRTFARNRYCISGVCRLSGNDQLHK